MQRFKLLSEELKEKLAYRPVCVHASMRSFGSNRIQAGELLDELLALGCTVIAPTFTYDLEQPAPAGDRPNQNGWDYDEWMPSSHERRFDIHGQHLSLSEMGIFPATLLDRSERVRGNHPINSFAGVGPRASEIIDMQAPHRVYGPFEKLCEGGGLVFLIGVDYSCLTLLHFAEQCSGQNLFRRWALDYQGRIIACQVGGCSDGFNAFEEVLSSYDELIGTARFRILEAAAVLKQAVRAIRSEPEIGRCGNPQCQRCRDASLGGPILV